MPTTIPVSNEYRDAIRFVVVLQVLLTLLFITLLDDGHVAKIAGYAMIGFWAGVAVMLARRPQTPGHADLLYIRYGYLASLVVAGFCAAVLDK